MRVRDEQAFFQIVNAAFALRRKTMTNSLCASLRLSREEAQEMMERAGLDEKIRGERLTLEQLAALADIWQEKRA